MIIICRTPRPRRPWRSLPAWPRRSIASRNAWSGPKDPGEDPPPPHDTHAAAPSAEHLPHGAPEAGTAHAQLDHSHGDDDEAGAPAGGSRAAELITTTLLAISWALSCYAFYDVGFAGHDAHVTIFNFITSGDLKVDWSLRIDSLTAVMLVVVTTVSGLVHLYSIGYMADDPYRPRFFACLSFFTFAMLMLVTADKLAQLFFGWEGVGLASYLLKNSCARLSAVTSINMAKVKNDK